MRNYACIAVKPGAQAGEKWCLHIGAWDDPDFVHLCGFETSFDAWAFCVAHLMIDPLRSAGIHEARLRKWTYDYKPGQAKPEQMKMWSEK